MRGSQVIQNAEKTPHLAAVRQLQKALVTKFRAKHGREKATPRKAERARELATQEMRLPIDSKEGAVFCLGRAQYAMLECVNTVEDLDPFAREVHDALAQAIDELEKGTLTLEAITRLRAFLPDRNTFATFNSTGMDDAIEDAFGCFDLKHLIRWVQSYILIKEVVRVLEWAGPKLATGTPDQAITSASTRNSKKPKRRKSSSVVIAFSRERSTGPTDTIPA